MQFHPSGAMVKATPAELRKLRGVASYQLGKGVGEVLFGRGTMVVHSPNTGRIRHLYRDESLLATLRANDGMLALAIAGAELLLRSRRFKNIVTVQSDVSDFIKQGRNVFAKHVKCASPTIRPEDEVIVIDNMSAECNDQFYFNSNARNFIYDVCDYDKLGGSMMTLTTCFIWRQTLGYNQL
jgi:archaeosine-15-forming tRNA-guanine transglycosylase